MVKQLTFQLGDGGSIPTSPLQLMLREISAYSAAEFNRRYHSRLPIIRNYFTCSLCFGAFFDGSCFATAMWSKPIARSFNDKPVLELRRFAICPSAPRYTASRLLGIMVKLIKKRFPEIKRLISYQDTEVHKGTIYKACGWKVGHITRAKDIRWGVLNPDGTGRRRSKIVTRADKVRWEYLL